MEEQVRQYLIHTLPHEENWVVELQEQAALDNVPIMDPVGINYIMHLIRLNKPKRILEIGAAIGYSALRMLEAYPGTSIVTIERDEHRYEKAIENITCLQKQDQIHIVYGDAIEKMNNLASNEKIFDFIFIDAAKGQYKRFFELAVPLLSEGGLIVSDNVLFRGYVANPEIAPKKYKSMVGKLRIYNEFLAKHPDFITTIVPIGDGVSVSIKK